MAGLQVVLAGSGRALELGPSARAGEPARVAQLREAVAGQLGVHPEQVILVLACEELADGPEADARLAGTAGATVTAVACACRVRPSEYDKHIVSYGKVPRKPWGGMDPRWCPGFLRLGAWEFPPASGININMMPFIFGYEASVPPEYRHYWPLVCRCPGLGDECGKVGYLTIQETTTLQGQSQRRPGLHTETPGTLLAYRGKAMLNIRSHWGQGHTEDGHNLSGGIYMASSIADSCRVWNVTLKDPHLVVGKLGDVEHLRPLLGEADSTCMGASELFWMTDTTPHESLPLPETALRQYFRVVTSSVSVWYEKHSTKNRFGIVPDPQVTQIITDYKFIDMLPDPEDDVFRAYHMSRTVAPPPEPWRCATM